MDKINHRGRGVFSQRSQRDLRLQPTRAGMRFRVASCGFVDRRLRHDNDAIHEITRNITKHLLRFSVMFGLCLISFSVFAKGSPDEIVLLREHTKPVEVTDRQLLKQFDPWSGQFIDWTKGLLAAPVDQSHGFEVFFYMKWPGRHSAYDRGALKMIYQIRYIRGPNGAPGYIYLPGKAEEFYSNNIGTIIREHDDGKWHRASQAWELFVSKATGREVSQCQPCSSLDSRGLAFLVSSRILTERILSTNPHEPTRNDLQGVCSCDFVDRFSNGFSE